MAINFPNAPTIGQLWPSPAVPTQPVYRWDGEKWTTQGASLTKTPVYTDGTTPMTAQLTLVTPPVATTDAASKGYVDGLLQNYLTGLVLSTAGGSTTFGIAKGQASDSTNVAQMVLASAYTKTTSAWAVGSGNGALDTGAIAVSTWYHVHLIKRLDTGVVDVLFSLSATAPTLPTSYTVFRRIGAIKTNASSQWIKFIQDGDLFQWDVDVLEISVTNPGVAAVTRTLANTPLGVRVEAIINVTSTATVQADIAADILISDLSVSSQTTSNAAAVDINSYNTAATGNFQFGVKMRVMTNTSQQVRSLIAISGATTILTIVTHGWIDLRGKL